MKKAIVLSLLALLLCSVTFPAFAVTEPVEATTEATEPTIRRGRPTNPYPKDPLPFYAPNRPTQPTTDPSTPTDPTTPSTDEGDRLFPVLLIGGSVILIACGFIVYRRKSK